MYGKVPRLWTTDTCATRNFKSVENIITVFRNRLHDPRRRKEKIAIDARVETITLPDIAPEPTPLPESTPVSETEDRLQNIYDALILGTRDYVRKM